MTDAINILAPGETIRSFHNMPEPLQNALSIAYAIHFKKKAPFGAQLLHRLFTLGNPQMIIGMNKDQTPYFRIAVESQQVMKVIFTNYLDQ